MYKLNFLTQSVNTINIPYLSIANFVLDLRRQMIYRLTFLTQNDTIMTYKLTFSDSTLFLPINCPLFLLKFAETNVD